MARLYLRQIRVDVSNYLSVDSLRITYQVNRGIKDAQPSSVTITNLVPETASRIAEGDALTLTAGYPGRSGVILIGAITDVDSRRQGTDRVTTMTLDVGRDRSELRFERSYGPGATRHIILRDLAAVMGLQLGDLSLVPDTPQPNYVSDAPVNAAMTSLTRSLNIEWAEVDGRLVFTPAGASPGHSGTGTITVNESTGLVGSVTVTDTGVKLKTLIQPRAYPGTAMNLTSDAATGMYRITETINRGSNWGDQLVTEITAVRGSS